MILAREGSPGKGPVLFCLPVKGLQIGPVCLTFSLGRRPVRAKLVTALDGIGSPDTSLCAFLRVMCAFHTYIILLRFPYLTVKLDHGDVDRGDLYSVL